jgi:hypothetical protein
MSVIRSLLVLLVLVILIPIVASFLRVNQEMREQNSEQSRLQSLERYTVTRGDVQLTSICAGDG